MLDPIGLNELASTDGKEEVRISQARGCALWGGCAFASPMFSYCGHFLGRDLLLTRRLFSRGRLPLSSRTKRASKASKSPPSSISPPPTPSRPTTPFQNHVDEGGGMFRDTLRNEYPTPLPPYAAGPGWWDGDGANSANTDRQRSEPKGIVGLGHQQVEQTFEYSFDFRTDPTFTATSNFCHIFQLKATNGDDSPPLATISLYKNGSGIQGRVDCFTDGTSGTPQNEIIPTTFNYTAGQWIHFVIRITPCAQGETTGGIQLSVNGGPSPASPTRPSISRAPPTSAPNSASTAASAPPTASPSAIPGSNTARSPDTTAPRNVLTWTGRPEQQHLGHRHHRQFSQWLQRLRLQHHRPDQFHQLLHQHYHQHRRQRVARFRLR